MIRASTVTAQRVARPSRSAGSDPATCGRHGDSPDTSPTGGIARIRDNTHWSASARDPLRAVRGRCPCHQVRYHGVFANRSGLRRFLPPAPPRPEELDLDAGAPAVTGVGGSTAAQAPGQTPSPARRRRIPWAQLLRRLLHIDALACPRCSTSKQSVPMVVLAFLTDPDVVGRILRHLGLSTCAPALAPAGAVPCPQLLMQQALSFSSAIQERAWSQEGDTDCGEDGGDSAPAASQPPTIRPPP